MRGELLRDHDDLTAGSSVAVKMYKPWVLREAGQLERIFRELEIGRTVRHPNVVHIVAALFDDTNKPALVMRYYDGETLQEYLTRHRKSVSPIPLTNALKLLGQIADGVAALHSRDVIHRDIKPANVILCDGVPILADLGVVRSSNMPEQTSTGAFLGTIRYAAPEYLMGEKYDRRVDLYSVGTIAYELFWNREFFERQQHWAKLVAAKAAADKIVGVAMLDDLAKRSDLCTARFCAEIVGHTLCAEEDRDLDLVSLGGATETELWRSEFHMEGGVLVSGETEFEDAFRTARRAAEFVRAEFTESDISLLRSHLTERTWRGSAIRRVLGVSIVDRLLAFRAARDHYRRPEQIEIAPSLREAIVLGLI